MEGGAGGVGAFDEEGGKVRGTKNKIELEDWMLDQAKEIYASCPRGALFARIDAFRRNNTLFVEEVEMIEPELYFSHGKDFAERFHAAFKKRIS